ncbi:predicted protein [Sclerotinia sclerotiorum 1980 UF-70]|uniref:Uncharacterized protein n=1 Tax=Sclerotinia sclerotiorum (strain ATCC 18683 / 1980 / Ss-1) TaxID=665079 RepID=A7E5V7_SCLS1|nr:predicted protein [Sclerotinia sclerotiorum 1980 UF-70]EDN91279.1 predicted protein [Sclerotinia sclerotiorum 1980 UF-70]
MLPNISQNILLKVFHPKVSNKSATSAGSPNSAGPANPANSVAMELQSKCTQHSSKAGYTCAAKLQGPRGIHLLLSRKVGGWWVVCGLWEGRIVGWARGGKGGREEEGGREGMGGPE